MFIPTYIHRCQSPQFSTTFSAKVQKKFTDVILGAKLKTKKPTSLSICPNDPTKWCGIQFFKNKTKHKR